MRNWLALVTSVTLIAGCSAHYPAAPTSTPTLAAIRVFYASPHTSITAGNSVSLLLYTVNTDGVYQALTQSAASWFSTNTGVATVTNGSVRGVGHGDTDVVANYQGKTATVRVVVQETPLRYPRLDIRWTGIIETGLTITSMSALYFESANSSRDVSSQAAWSSSDPSVFAVDGAKVTPAGPGTAAVTATFSELTATAFASVPPLRKLP